MSFKFNNVDRITSDRINVPSGTTEQRPAGAIAGSTRFNTTLGKMEVYTGFEWLPWAETGDPPGAFTPPFYGDSYCGGIYWGVTNANNTWYYLIVSPISSGQACCAWRVEASYTCATPGTCSTTNGHANTYPALNNTTHPAGNFTATRTINGFSDWYLPSIAELQNLRDNPNTWPNNQLAERFCNYCYWTSTEASGRTDAAGVFDWSTGCVLTILKKEARFLRAVRRQPM
jgi:hypothetical protein